MSVRLKGLFPALWSPRFVLPFLVVWGRGSAHSAVGRASRFLAGFLFRPLRLASDIAVTARHCANYSRAIRLRAVSHVRWRVSRAVPEMPALRR